MHNFVEAIERSIEHIDMIVSDKDKVREEAIRITRDIIRIASNVVTHTLNEDFDLAEKNLIELRKLVKNLNTILAQHPDLAYSGLVYNAVAEYVEAELLFSFIRHKKLVSFDELSSIGVHYIPYIHGLCDLVGELKRYGLELIRKSRFEEANHIAVAIEHIYHSLRKLIEYPDALVPGLRRKMDIMRRVIEDYITFLLDMEYRDKLIKNLRRFRRYLRNPPGST
ncbi:MAG: haloacid dehalogenase [Thermoprotei archaeon]|nr:MAG: haloacid dehalogenase [Thermoprotei archaeon]